MPMAARMGDLHTCPMSDGPKPHVGGPILPPCLPTVLTGGPPQARVTDMLTCVGPPDVIAKGSATVLVGGLMAARVGDMTVHGGVITLGCPTVMIGDAAGGGGSGGGASMVTPRMGAEGKGADHLAIANALIAAAKEGVPFCEQCQKG